MLALYSGPFVLEGLLSSRKPRLVCFEAIADAPDGLDFFAKRAQFFAQARHVIVYRTIEAILAVSPDLLQEYFPFEDPARM
jgi:hypothetical protein